MSYLEDVHSKETNALLVSLNMDAMNNDVPIITEEGLRFLRQMICLKDVSHILEIGSAIGYSAIAMAMIDTNIKVTTLERDSAMIKETKKNITQAGLQDRITLIDTDALTFDETTLEEPFDMLFIDGAKSQSIPFFKKYAPLIKKHGIIIVDNLLFHGFLEDGVKRPANRNTRQLVKKIDTFNRWVLNHKDYDTSIYPIGDGMSLSIKRID